MATCETCGEEVLAKDGRNYLHSPEDCVSVLAARVAEKDRALAAISDIRDSIVGGQMWNWSEHGYPLVAALDAAGYRGAGYEIARANLGTLIEQIKTAEARVAELTRDERSAVERGNSLAREVQDERAHLGVAMRELRRAVVRESAGVNPDDPRGIELQPGNCLDVLDVVRGVRRERDDERAAHAATKARVAERDALLGDAQALITRGIDVATSERAAHARTRARLEAAERVVEAARPMRAHYSVAGRNLTEALDALSALPAAAPADVGDNDDLDEVHFVHGGEDGWVRIGRYDHAHRRSLWCRLVGEDGMGHVRAIELCSGREGDDAYVKLTPDDAQFELICDVLLRVHGDCGLPVPPDSDAAPARAGHDS